MHIEQIYTGCLAQGAYYIHSGGEGIIIDPLREVGPYLDRLSRDGVVLKYIFETHFHADFVSGHLDLSAKTQAPIVFGPLANPSFPCIIAKDDQEFLVGKIRIKVLHTPGHTMESSCYLLIDEQGTPHSLFSGDTLFLGDVGRPDLAQKAIDTSQEELAGILYDSLLNKIMPLPNSVMVYPAHGAGSSCGKNMMKETMDSLGHQKEMNYALNQPTKEAFVEAVLDGLMPAPAYFPMNVSMNKKGYNSMDEVMGKALRSLGVEAFEMVAERTQSVILDTRSPEEFAKGFIPRSINIGIDGQFAPWVGSVIADSEKSILLVTAPGREVETITRLSRVGFDCVLGYLQGGFDTWISAEKKIDRVNRITASQFAAELAIGESVVIDVRKEAEYRGEHIEEAFNKPLDFISDWVQGIDSQRPFFMHCAGGYRSMIAASILKSRGIHNFKEIEGGFGEIAKTTAPKTDFISQSKLQKT